jgi:hypothetical protein
MNVFRQRNAASAGENWGSAGPPVVHLKRCELTGTYRINAVGKVLPI